MQDSLKQVRNPKTAKKGTIELTKAWSGEVDRPQKPLLVSYCEKNLGKKNSKGE